MSNIDDLIEQFNYLEDWEDRYRYLIDLGKTLPPLDEQAKTDEHKVHGCTSQVWLVAKTEAKQILQFAGDSDSFIVKGLIYVLFAAYNGKTAQEIKDIDIEAIFKQLGLEEHLSPNRSNGFFAMVNYIKSIAHDHASTYCE